MLKNINTYLRDRPVTVRKYKEASAAAAVPWQRSWHGEERRGYIAMPSHPIDHNWLTFTSYVQVGRDHLFDFFISECNCSSVSKQRGGRKEGSSTKSPSLFQMSRGFWQPKSLTSTQHLFSNLFLTVSRVRRRRKQVVKQVQGWSKTFWLTKTSTHME